MDPEQISASDGFAIAMLAMILTSMAIIGGLLFCMFRNASRRDPHVDELLDELAEDEKKAKLARTHGDAEKKPEPWEKDGDWWKP